MIALKVVARLSLLADHSTELALKKALVLHSEHGFASTVIAICFNVLHKVLPISEDEVAKLRPFKAALFRVAELHGGGTKAGAAQRRKQLAQKRLLEAASACVSVALPQLRGDEWSANPTALMPSLPPPSESATLSTEPP